MIFSEELRGNPKLITSFVTATIIFLTVIGLLIAWRDGMPLLAALIGTATGWVSGILFAPYAEEAKRFRQISRGIAGFLTGYGVGKIDRVFDLLLDKTGGPPLILNYRLQRSFWVCLTCLLVTVVTVFVARTYWQGVEADVEDEEDER